MDVLGRWNPVCFEESLKGGPIEAIKEEFRALVSGKEGVVVFAQDLDVNLLGLGPESCQVIDVQKHFNARGRQELAMATKTLPPFPSGGNYSLKTLSHAILKRQIQQMLCQCHLGGPSQSTAKGSWSGGDTNRRTNLLLWHLLLL